MSASPPLAPSYDGPLYFVLCDYGPDIGRAYSETDPDHADRRTVLERLQKGEYTGPVQVVEVDLAAGRARDASTDFADALLEQAALRDLPADVSVFVQRQSSLMA